MVRKMITKKKSHKKRIVKPHITQTSSEVQVEKILVDNFVSLQKVMTNLSLSFDKLTHQISSLLELFEISAKALVEKEAKQGGKDNKKLIEKIDVLMDQNKTIARGLTLMHEKTSEQTQIQKPMPQRTPQLPSQSLQPTNMPRQGRDMSEYQKSISSKEAYSSEPKFKSLPKN